MELIPFVANIAVLILVLSLVVIGFIMYKNKTKLVTDNIVIGQCPDYWNMVKENDKNYCVNVKNLGKASCNKKMDFFSGRWMSSDGECNKSKWAKWCDLSWDGITNNPNNSKCS